MKLQLSNIQLSILIISVLIIGWWFWPSKQQLKYYYSPNCPHCVKFMPIWEKIKVNVDKVKINCDIQNCSGIVALPTIKFNGIEYEGERTKENIETFVEKNI